MLVWSTMASQLLLSSNMPLLHLVYIEPFTCVSSLLDLFMLFVVYFRRLASPFVSLPFVKTSNPLSLRICCHAQLPSLKTSSVRKQGSPSLHRQPLQTIGNLSLRLLPQRVKPCIALTEHFIACDFYNDLNTLHLAQEGVILGGWDYTPIVCWHRKCSEASIYPLYHRFL